MIKDKYNDRFLNASMEEVLDVLIAEDLDLETLNTWSLFKIAQFLEKIAYEGAVTRQNVRKER